MPSLTTQDRLDTMQEQSSELGVGRKGLTYVSQVCQCALHFLGVVAEVDLGGDRVAVDRDEAVVIIGFEVHVDHATALDVVHLRTK